MKKVLSLLLITLMVISVSGQDKEKEKKQKTEKPKKEKIGWKLAGVLPAISVDSDLGFQYGALFEFCNYGNPSVYPDFLDHTYTEVSHYTKGSGIYRFMYESNHIIRGTHFSVDLSYLPDQASHFYGFNGYESVFNKSWMDDKDSLNYKSRMFYRYQRNQFRIKTDIQGKLIGDHIKWSAGFAFNNFTVSEVDVDRLNKGKKDKLPSNSEQPGLLKIYEDLMLISPNEANGGWVNTLKAGVAWDSRDNKPNPMKGIWTELGIETAPGFMGNDWGFTKFYITHRQYFTLIKDDLSFVYRLGYQTTIFGDVPFFYQSQVITSLLTGQTNEGLGGSMTLRGVLRNRVIGDGFVYGNFEFRWKPLYFKFIKQDWYLGLDAFYDVGRVTKKIKTPGNLELMFNNRPGFTNRTYSDYFKPEAEKFHHSAGMSLMIVMNRNFIIAVDVGKAFNEQDGNIGFTIGLNYLF
ncbi:MAG: BamA/TamA family outer membrane protein [Bacteroidia bacterium]|nr:BamA/TamA family outer membrane protein [Bacteroidia bacterium]